MPFTCLDRRRVGLRTRNRTAPRLISYSPAQEMHTWWERALIPFIFCRLSQLYSYAAVNDPNSPRAAANGQYLLIRRDAYEAIGGHAAVCGEVLEDVALAQRAKEAGLTLRFGPGEQIARVRMYATFRAMWEGWTKNLSPLLAQARQGVTRELLSVIPWIPLVCLTLAPSASDFWGAGAAAVGRAPCKLTPPCCGGIVSRCPASYTIWLGCRYIAPPAGFGPALRAGQGGLERARIPNADARAAYVARETGPSS